LLLVIDRCPSCSGGLEVRELHCAACGLTLRGDFASGLAGSRPTAARAGTATGLPHLTEEQLAFLRLFVRSRGNLTEVERTLGVSYPTVRAKLDELILALAEQPEPLQRAGGQDGQERPQEETAAPSPRSRREVLELIEQGRLSVSDGVALLKRFSAEAT
jgi:hypothetical protein